MIDLKANNNNITGVNTTNTIDINVGFLSFFHIIQLSCTTSSQYNQTRA